MPQTVEGLQTWDLIEYLGSISSDFSFQDFVTLADTRGYDRRAVVELFPYARAGMLAGERDLENTDGQ